jgi:hypothetical protein
LYGRRTSSMPAMMIAAVIICIANHPARRLDELLPWNRPDQTTKAAAAARVNVASADGLMSAFKRWRRDFSSAAAVTELGWMHRGGGEAVDLGDQALMRGLDTAPPAEPVHVRNALAYWFEEHGGNSTRSKPAHAGRERCRTS